ncbi:MAG: hypothetical protein ACLFRF_04935 [Desulfobacterales bacterium]
MNINRFHNRTGRTSIFTIVLTAMITLLIAGSAAWYAGYLGPPAKTAATDMTVPAEDETLYT